MYGVGIYLIDVIGLIYLIEHQTGSIVLYSPVCLPNAHGIDIPINDDAKHLQS